MCVGVCSITVEQHSEAFICDGVFKTVANSNVDLDMAQKNHGGRLFVQEKRIWMTKEHQKRRSSVIVKKSCKIQRNSTKNKPGNANSTNNCLVHPEETPDNVTLQATTRSGHIDRGKAKAQTELTCAVSQAERILNMCEIGYEIHTSLNFSFKFGGVIHILFNINPV